jgi:hypothetical protein
MTDRRTEVIERALGYPFAVPDRSFALVEGRRAALQEAEVDRAARLPLLAYGSNAAPAVLARKLGPEAEPVQVIRATLRGFDAVYSGHVSAYGSVPATLLPSPCTELATFVAYLTEVQLKLVSETEPNYELNRISGLSCRLEVGEEVVEAHAYLSRHGCLLRAGAPVAVREVPARRRAFAEMSQRQVLDHLRDRIRPEMELEEFILECVAAGPSLSEELDRGKAAEREAGQ